MIDVRRDLDRHRDRRPGQQLWHSLSSDDPADLRADAFGTLETLDEDRVLPGVGRARPRRTLREVVTYVREGSLAFEGSSGAGAIHAGEFQHRTCPRGVRHRETNASRTHAAHMFQLVLRCPDAELEGGHVQKRFSNAQRRGGLCLIASPDARRGSLRMYQDVMLYSALLDPGQHVVHELTEGQTAWLHVIQGEVTVGDLALTTGDGAGFTTERTVSLIARVDTEIILVNLGRLNAEKDAFR